MTKEALKLALEALERGETELRWQAITAIKEALAQPEQEPVAYRYKYPDGFWRFSNGERVNGSDSIKSQALYTTPPQRKWVGLTDDEMLMIYGQQHEGKKYSLGRMVEQALKEKNNVS